jgi:hypothetical protein
MNEPHLLADRHSFLKEMIFLAKSSGLMCARFVKNMVIHHLQKFPAQKDLCASPVVAASESLLWNTDDNTQNWILTAGKVENLRIAVRKLNGIEVPARAVFSFWKHIGYPGKVNGFVVGREIREGCIIPTIAGGLCQLSNALYDAALKAGFEIIERHKHTRVIKGSLAEIDRDATVKWNYLDLRFVSNHAFRIEAELTEDKLVVSFKSRGMQDRSGQRDFKSATPSFLNDCYSCGNLECFKNPHKSRKTMPQGKTTFILDERWAEYDEYVRHAITAGDEMLVPFTSKQTFRIQRFAWPAAPMVTVRTASIAALYRSLNLRLLSKTNVNIFSSTLHLDKLLAEKMIQQISIESTHVVISQNLLPFAWTAGILGGRTFDVLMTRLPLEKLHQRLDFAFQKFPESSTLHDFRAAQELVTAETTALNASRKIITPHEEIAEIFNHKCINIGWRHPIGKKTFSEGNVILFPASSLGRKGAYEVRRLARELQLTVRVIGVATENEKFWTGINVETASGNIFENVCAVVYPVYVEHQPRILLRAIAYDIPVITTVAAGIPANNFVSVVPVGDYIAIKEAFIKMLETTENLLKRKSLSE